MVRTLRMLSVGLSLAAHLLLAGAQLPHCHAHHDSAAEHQHAEHTHGSHASPSHAHASHSHHRHAHTHVPHALRRGDHRHQPHEAEGSLRECCHSDCGCCLADHGIPAAIPPRVERGSDSGIDLLTTAATPLAATPHAQLAVELRQALVRAGHATGRVAALHDLLPHVLRL